MKTFPFLSLKNSQLLLRCGLAIVFLSHAIVRIIGNTVERFGGFLESKGLPYGVSLVWGITVFEIVGALLLVANYGTKWISVAFILMLAAGIQLIHAPLGWFVGEHGTGGVEYSFMLMIALMVTASADRTFRN